MTPLTRTIYFRGFEFSQPPIFFYPGDQFGIEMLFVDIEVPVTLPEDEH